MESRVVLICLKPYLSLSQINDKTLSSMFSQFACVTNVSIFACTSVLKAFVEFETPEIARLAVDHFNGRQFNFGSVHVYPSNKSCIKPKPASSSNQKPSSMAPNIPQCADSKSHKSDFLSHNNSNPYSSDNHPLQELEASDRKLMSPLSQKNPREHSGFLSLEDSDESKLSRHAQNLNPTPATSQYTRSAPWPSKFSARTSPTSQSPVRYVQVTGLNPQIVNAKSLMNLMCCFGNVKRAIHKQSEGFALVLYSSDLEASTAIHYLSSQRFFGATTESKDSLLTCTEIAKYDFERNGYTITDGQKQDFRYKSSLRIKFNAPSQLLHFTNLPDCCTAPILYQIICAVKEPLKIMKLARRNSKDAGMMLVEFNDLSSAIEVLSVLHNKKINDNMLHVSFSQSRISQYS